MSDFSEMAYDEGFSDENEYFDHLMDEAVDDLRREQEANQYNYQQEMELYPLGRVEVGVPDKNGCSNIRLNFKEGLIDKGGNIIIPCQYDLINEFSDGIASVKLDNLWGFVNHAGQLIIPLDYWNVKPFKEGLAAVQQDEK